MMKRGLIAITALVVAASAARATTMVPLPLRTLVERADRVVLATVESQTAQWSASHDAIYTDVKLRVTRSYKGAAKPGDVVVVRREGGSVDGIGMRVFGAAAFEVGEEALVFVEQRGTASFVVGMAQGKLRVTLAEGNKKVVAADLSGVAFTRAPDLAVRGVHALADVEREIRGLVQGLDKGAR